MARFLLPALNASTRYRRNKAKLFEYERKYREAEIQETGDVNAHRYGPAVRKGRFTSSFTRSNTPLTKFLDSSLDDLQRHRHADI
jgi:hypothetical protein